MLIVFQRHFLSQRRDTLACLLILIVNILQGILIGSIFWQMPAYVKDYGPIQLADWTQDVLPWENSWFNATIYGVDGNGYQPVFETIDFGENGYGRSLVDTLLMDEKAQKNALDLFFLIYDHFKIPYQGYPSLDWLDEIIGSSSGERRLEPIEDPLVALAKKVKLVLQALNLLDFTYYEYDWSELAYCDTILESRESSQSKNSAYYVCLIVQANDLMSLVIEDYLKWIKPDYVLGFVADQCGKAFPCKDWLKKGHVPHGRSLGAVDGPLDLSWDAFLNLDEQTIIELSDKYGLTPWMEQNIGREPFVLLRPIQDYVRRISECTHPLCNSLKSMGQGLRTTGEKLVAFVLASYTTLGTMFNISGVIFFISLFLGFSAYDVLLTFPKQRLLFNKETASGLYQPSTYYFAKTIADVPFQCLPSILLSTILYFMVGLHRIGDSPIQQFLVYMLISLLITFAAYGFGYMVSAASSKLEFAMLLAPLFLMVWLTIAGFFLRDNDLPSWITWFKYVSFYRWGFFAHTSNIFRPGSYFGNIPNEVNLAISGITETRIWLSCLMLFSLNIVYRVVGFFFLKFLHRKVGLES